MPKHAVLLQTASTDVVYNNEGTVRNLRC